MKNFEQHLFEQSFELIADRFNTSNSEQQHKLLCQLGAIAKKQTPIATHRPQEEVLADIKKAMQGDRASVFFAHSYVSWYRSYQNENAKPQLHHWSQLDVSNRHLFLEMLGLRDLGHWDDEALFLFEQYCLSVIGK